MIVLTCIRAAKSNCLFSSHFLWYWSNVPEEISDFIQHIASTSEYQPRARPPKRLDVEPALLVKMLKRLDKASIVSLNTGY